MPEPITRAQDTVSLDNSPTMAMTTLYGAAVGPIGKDYYLPIFSRFEAAGQATLSWNLSACLYTVNWMIFRRLWGPALMLAGALLGSAVLLVTLGLLVLDWPHELIYQLLLACLGFGMLASGLWGNALLYNHCRQAMMTAVADNKTLVQACAQLSQRASTRQRFIRLLLTNTLLLTLAGLAYLRWVGWDGSDTPVPDSNPAPALAASAVAPAASAASLVASAAQAPASETPAPQVSGLLATSAASAASAASSTTALAAASAALAVPASAPASVSVVVPPAVIQTATSAAQAASAPTPAAASASERATSAPRGRNAAPALVHSSAAAPPATTRVASKPAARAASKPASKVSSAKAPKTTTAKASQATKAAPPAKGLFINAGLFANPDNARNALAKLQAAGLPATAQEIDTSQGPRTRIRVGPYVKPAQAEAGIQKIKALGLDAALVKP